MNILLVEAIMTSSPSRKKAGSVTLKFETMKEISNDEFSLMDQYYRQPGHLAFKMDEISLDEIPDDNTQIKGQISPSKSLRMKLFALHMKKGGKKDNFTPYYTRVMAQFEQSVQDEIDNIED